MLHVKQLLEISLSLSANLNIIQQLISFQQFISIFCSSTISKTEQEL